MLEALRRFAAFDAGNAAAANAVPYLLRRAEVLEVSVRALVQSTPVFAQPILSFADE